MTPDPRPTRWSPTIRDGLAITASLALVFWTVRPEGRVESLVYRFVSLLFACGLIGAILAGWHGLGRFGGFCLGLMLGPLGVILVTSLRPDPDDDAEARP